MKAVSTGDIVSINSGRVVPRLAVAYDVRGGGNQIWHVTYGRYSGRYNEALIGANSPVGNPATVESFSTSYGVNLVGGRGHAEGSYVFRRTTSLIDDFVDRTTGTTNVVVNGVSAGMFTNILYKNVDSEVARRQYQGLVFQSRYRIRNNWSVSGHYTVQLQNDGNYEGEATNQPGNVSALGDYPEALRADRYFPENLFNNRKLIGWNTTISQNTPGPKDALGIATTFTQGGNFGKASGNTVTNLNYTGIDAFPRAFSGAPAGGRTFRVAVGFRF